MENFYYRKLGKATGLVSDDRYSPAKIVMQNGGGDAADGIT